MTRRRGSRGRALAHWLAHLAPALWRDIEESGAIPAGAAERARDEWDALALYAGIRGLVAAGGFNRETADEVDALNDTAGRGWTAGTRAHRAARFAEYGGIGQALQHAGAAEVEARLGEACAAHVAADAPARLADVFAALHESLAEAAAEVARAPHPPLALLHEAGGRLSRAGIAWGLGGSGLLHALGLSDAVGDWDLQADASPEACERACAGLAFERSDHSGCHADHKLALWDGTAEIVIRFAFSTPQGIVRIPVAPHGAWLDVPLASAEGWAVAYALLGTLEDDPSRLGKSERLFAHLAVTGADAATRDALLAQPLPGGLAAQLLALPKR